MPDEDINTQDIAEQTMVEDATEKQSDRSEEAEVVAVVSEERDQQDKNDDIEAPLPGEEEAVAVAVTESQKNPQEDGDDDSDDDTKSLDTVSDNGDDDLVKKKKKRNMALPLLLLFIGIAFVAVGLGVGLARKEEDSSLNLVQEGSVQDDGNVNTDTTAGNSDNQSGDSDDSNLNNDNNSADIIEVPEEEGKPSKYPNCEENDGRTRWPELVGMPGEDAKAMLQGCYGDQYNIVLIAYGQVITMEMRPGRVKLMLDENGNVLTTPYEG